MTRHSPKWNMVPKAVLMRSGLVSLTTARPVNTTQPRTTVNSTSPMTNVFNKAHSTVRRPINKNTAFKYSNFNQRVNAIKDKNVNAARPKAVVNVGNPQQDLQKKGVTPKEGKSQAEVQLKLINLGSLMVRLDEGFFVGNSSIVKRLEYFTEELGIVKENFGIQMMNYEPIVTGTQSNGLAGTKASDNAGQARKETINVKYYILLPLWTVDPPFFQDPKSSQDDGFKPSSDDGNKVNEDPRTESKSEDQEKDDNVNNTNNVNATSTNEVNAVEADMTNLDTTIQVSPIPTTRIHKDHPLDQVIRDLPLATQTRRMSKNLEEHGRNQEGDSCIEGSKLDRGYAGRASTIQVTKSLNFSRFTKWKKGYMH
ncbi:hypothetical protein Tco_0850783 [Tanacetum coccineum]